MDAAETAYGRLRDAVRRETELNARALGLSPWELEQTAKLVSVLQVRVDELRSGKNLGVGAEAGTDLSGFFERYLLDQSAAFPFDVSPEAVGPYPVAAQLERVSRASAATAAAGLARPAAVPEARGAENVSDVSVVSDGSLLPPLRLREGDRALIVCVRKLAVKVASQETTGAGNEKNLGSRRRVEAFCTVSVARPSSGELLEAAQDTPSTTGREPRYIVFENTRVHVQTPLDALLRGSADSREATRYTAGDDVAVILELKRHEPKKRKASTETWCFFRLSEIDARKETQQLALEVYSKPTDLKCAKLSRVSKKDIYAHVDVIVRTE